LGPYGAYLQGSMLYQTGATQNLNTFDDALLGDTGGFVTFDFTGGIRKDNWTLDLFMQNAFDQRGILTKNTFCSITFCSNSSRAYPIKPQFFGVKFGQKF
jgi:outer membrane receptor protein involved in Fe transport